MSLRLVKLQDPMSKREKRLQKLRQNLKDVSFNELKQILEDYGFDHIRTAGSHHTFIAMIGKLNWRVTIPFHRPIKIPYVKAALKAIDEIIQIQGIDQEETKENGESED
jgi:predicted RNA binding protein YcfA (HicA-like mRNA interferase family)